MIPHMPLLREAEASCIPQVASHCARAREARHKVQRFRSLGKRLIFTPPDVQIVRVRRWAEGRIPLVQCPWHRASGQVLWRPGCPFLPLPAVLAGGTCPNSYNGGRQGRR